MSFYEDVLWSAWRSLISLHKVSANQSSSQTWTVNATIHGAEGTQELSIRISHTLIFQSHSYLNKITLPSALSIHLQHLEDGSRKEAGSLLLNVMLQTGLLLSPIRLLLVAAGAAKTPCSDSSGSWEKQPYTGKYMMVKTISFPAYWYKNHKYN